MKFFKILIFIFIFLISGISTFAQVAIIAAGGGEGLVSFSIGQIFYSSDENLVGTVNHGMQQSFELTPILVDDSKNINCSIFPNPTSSLLFLKVETQNFENVTYQLYDSRGTILLSKKIFSEETSIIIRNLPSANYFLQVTRNKIQLKTFNIIKQ